MIACLGSVLYLNNGANNAEYIVNMAYNVKEKNQIINSTRTMNICTNQFDQKLETMRNICTLYTTEQEVVVTRISKDQLSVYVVYKSIDEKKFDSVAKLDTVDEMIDDQKQEYDGYLDELDLVFKAVVSTKGVLLSLESPNGEQPDTTIRLTERLIEQTFPEIDPALYNSPFALKSGSRRLRNLSAEEAEELPT